MRVETPVRNGHREDDDAGRPDAVASAHIRRFDIRQFDIEC